jgi:signal recognition particle subunit SRP54
MATRILGMGDIVSLVEKARDTVDEQESRKLAKKIRKNSFTLQDFLEQLRQLKKMGPLQDLIAMIPGVGSQLKGADIDPKALTRTEAIISSMTIKEREKPQIINASRKRRICAGSGTTVQDVNRLLKQFDTMRSMMKRMNRMSGKRGQAAALRNLMPQ